MLIFVSGKGRISEIKQFLEEQYEHTDYKLEIFTAHGGDNMTGPLFLLPEEGVRKIIVSTPICETSITIEDVTIVIDTGFCNRVMFSLTVGETVLTREWISQATAKQRAGSE